MEEKKKMVGEERCMRENNWMVKENFPVSPMRMCIVGLEGGYGRQNWQELLN